MLHLVVFIGGLAGLIWYAFGQTAARVFTGAALGAVALTAVAFVSVAMYDVHRQTNRTQIVKMGAVR